VGTIGGGKQNDYQLARGVNKRADTLQSTVDFRLQPSTIPAPTVALNKCFSWSKEAASNGKSRRKQQSIPEKNVWGKVQMQRQKQSENHPQEFGPWCGKRSNRKGEGEILEHNASLL